MNNIGFFTAVRREFERFLLVPVQTLVSPWVSALLYILVFGSILGKRIEVFEGQLIGPFPAVNCGPGKIWKGFLNHLPPGIVKQTENVEPKLGFLVFAKTQSGRNAFHQATIHPTVKLGETVSYVVDISRQIFTIVSNVS